MLDPALAVGLLVVAAAVLVDPVVGRRARLLRPATAPGGRTRAVRHVLGRLVGPRTRRTDPRRVVAVLEAFAAELRAGRAAGVALLRAADSDPTLLPAALGAVRLGGDVPAALVVDAESSGAPVLRRFAACWRVGAGTGAGLAAAADRLAAATRESERARWELAARTAEPRATMRVLAALPAAGVALGALLGADALGWLVGTGPGRVVLVAGLALDLVGLLWARRIVASVESEL